MSETTGLQSAVLNDGLSDREACRLLGEHGTNEIHHEAGRSPWAIRAGQFRGAPIGPISRADCALSLAPGSITVTVIEITKLAGRSFRRAGALRGTA